MISQTAEYALRAVVYLAEMDPQPQTTARIAAAAQIPSGYLAKILQGLCRARLVQSQRGLNGGFTLLDKPDCLSMMDVVKAVDPIRRFAECPLGLHGIDLCGLHRRLDDVARSIQSTLGGTTIADLLDGSGHGRPYCSFPCVPDTVA